MKPFNLCLLGYGNVGHALVELLMEKRALMREQYGIECRVTGVASRRLGWIAWPDGLDEAKLLADEFSNQVSPMPAEVNEWLKAARADVLFEITSVEARTGEPAVKHCRAALESGAHAITANKGAVVHGFAELQRLARERGRRFLFESAVADCLPVFSLFRGSFPAARLVGFRGVLNSTTSFIIEAMEQGRTFEDGVRRAQELGMAETDPGYDVDGWDAALKATAIANVLMKANLKLTDVRREGVRNLDAAIVQRARMEGKPFKLIARAKREADESVSVAVGPEQLSSDDMFANLKGGSLAVHFELDVLPGLTVVAHGPNLKSTAYGLLADFIEAVSGVSAV